jgi:DNA-binding NarL/FixJ family response regulator
MTGGQGATLAPAKNRGHVVADSGRVQLRPADRSPQTRSSSERVRVLIVDDDPMARRVVRDALQDAGLIVIGEARTAVEGIELSGHYRPDVVVVDSTMPELDGVAMTRRILAADRTAKVVLLTPSDDDESGLEGLRAGAIGVISKDIDLAALPRVLESARRGEAAISRRMTMRLIESLRTMRPDGAGMRPVRSVLTSREWEVLDLMCDERSTDEIAAELVLSPETVRSHVKGVLRKLGVGSRADAVQHARRLRSGQANEQTALSV